jgi:hypothetical protein
MVLNAEAPAKFGVRMTNPEFFRELSVFDEMLSVRRVLWIERERNITRPFAALIEPVTRDATGTAQICDDEAGRFDDKQEKPQPESPSHLPTFPVADPHARKSIGSLEPNRPRLFHRDGLARTVRRLLSLTDQESGSYAAAHG